MNFEKMINNPAESQEPKETSENQELKEAFQDVDKLASEVGQQLENTNPSEITLDQESELNPKLEMIANAIFTLTGTAVVAGSIVGIQSITGMTSSLAQIMGIATVFGGMGAVAGIRGFMIGAKKFLEHAPSK